MEKAFPDMPINTGVEKVLALTTTGIASSAHTLLSLSFLIIPISLAVAIKFFQWIGPFAAISAVLVPIAALLYAEACLAEKGILPLSGEVLSPGRVGKAVYHDDGKDEGKSQEAKDLLALAHGGVLPPEHQPPPYTAPSDSSNGQIPVSSMMTGVPAPVEFSSARPTMPEVSGLGSAPAHSERTTQLSNASYTLSENNELAELRQILNRTSEILYGRQLESAVQNDHEALIAVNKLRLDIGLPEASGHDLPSVVTVAKETAATVGC